MSEPFGMTMASTDGSIHTHKASGASSKKLQLLVERFYAGYSDNEERIMSEFTKTAKEILKADENDFGSEDAKAPLSSSSLCRCTSGTHTQKAIEEIKRCFESCDRLFQKQHNFEEHEMIEDFVQTEQNLSRQRRTQARRLEAAEEKRLASEVAEFKDMRLKWQDEGDTADLQRRISDAERSYMRRKMVVAKASQVARGECRFQFSRVREFFDKLHNTRKEFLERQYKHSARLQSAVHRLSGTDDRVVSLDKQITSRLHEKKLNDLNELHLAQNLEYAVYLETMLDSLESVQMGKERAARALFELRVKELKVQKERNSKRNSELSELIASATMEMARVGAFYTEEAEKQEEAEWLVQERVQKSERGKTFQSSPAHPVMSVSQLYDTVLWSAASAQLSSTNDSILYGSEFDEDFVDSDEDKREDDDVGGGPADHEDTVGDTYWHNELNDDDWSANGSTSSTTGSTTSGGEDLQKRYFSSAGDMHLKQLAKDFREQIRVMRIKHKVEKKQDKKQYRKKVRALKKKNNVMIEKLLRKSLEEREIIRDDVTRRIESLAEDQEKSTKELRSMVEKDWQEMKNALKAAEHDRIRQAEERSFAKAQTLFSAQVFHEVRNALSSIVAMSEMTSSMREDDTVSPYLLVSSVDDMLEQIKEVVGYSLSMLNNVLDINKINSGAYEMKVAKFDIQDMVARATTMQLAKVGRQVTMNFSPSPERYIVASDADVVVRMITNLISNAVKFTAVGSVQPFVCPLEQLQSGSAGYQGNMVRLYSQFEGDFNQDAAGESLSNLQLDENENDTTETNTTAQESMSTTSNQTDEMHSRTGSEMKFLAVGVADTGPGLSMERLRLAETHIAQSDPGMKIRGVQNSGFGLHLAHLLAKAVNSKLNLASLEDCRRALSDVTLRAMEKRRQDMIDEASDKGLSFGTVLYFTLRLSEERQFEIAESSLDNEHAATFTPANTALEPKHEKFVFKPRPSPSSKDGSFRILVADDVPMLRKGMVHGLVSLFPDCPISISTACSAEDVLRAVASQPFDLLICDNEFRLDSTGPRKLTEDDTSSGRPCVFYDANKPPKESLRQSLKEYFDEERFTFEEDDGLLSGLDAVMQLVRTPESEHPFPPPLLMLLSGHKLHVQDDLGILVVQKPLKRSEFTPFLEASVNELLLAGRCTMDSDGSISNKHGAQIFCTR